MLSALIYINYSDTATEKNPLYFKVIKTVQSDYVDPSRINLSKMLMSAVDTLSDLMADVYVSDRKEDDEKVSFKLHIGAYEMAVAMKKNTPPEIFAETMNSIEQAVNKHSKEEERKKDIAVYLLNGMLRALDPHSNFFNVQAYEEFSNDSKGSFGGIGIFIDVLDSRLVVVSPIADTPADRAGLAANDHIRKIDGVSTTGMTVDDAINLIKGEIGTHVVLTISRSGWTQDRDYKIKRDRIFNSIDYYVFKESDKRIGYLRFRRFTRESTDSMKQTLNKIGAKSKDFGGLILDLRNNPGGFLDQAIGVSDLFIESGNIVATGKTEENIGDIYKAQKGGDFSGFPIVVLINQNSASAAEILAAALKQNNRAVLLGENTFGKASVQTVYDAFKNGSALKLTIAQYFTPDLKSIQTVGVAPHIAFEPLFTNKTNFKFLKNAFRHGEDNLENAFRWGNKMPDSLYTVNYVFSEDDFKRQDNDIYENGINLSFLRREAVFKLAYQTLSQKQSDNFPIAGGNINSGLLDAALKTAGAENRRYESLFVADMQKQGIVWDTWYTEEPTADSVHDVSVSLAFTKENKDGKHTDYKPASDELKPGEKLKVKVSAVNRMATPLSNVSAVFHSTDNRLNNVQLPLGVIKSGAATSAEAVFEPINGESGSVIPFEVSIFSNYLDTRVSAASHITVSGGQSPRYTVSAQTEPGSVNKEQGKILIGVQNLSSAVRGKPIVRLRASYTTGLKFQQQEFAAGLLNPGEQTTDNFEYRIEMPKLPPSVDRAKLPDTELKVQVLDANYKNIGFEQTYKIKDGTAVSAINIKNSPPEILPGNYSLYVSGQQTQLDITFSDDKQIKDYFAYLNGKKILYEIIGQQSHSVKIPLTLKKDSLNVLRVFSRDNEDVYTSKEVRIWSERVQVILLTVFGFVFVSFAGFQLSADEQEKRFIPRPELIRAVAFLLEEKYVDHERLRPAEMLKSAMERLSNQIPPLMYEYADSFGMLTIRLDDAGMTRNVPSDMNVKQLAFLLEDISLFVKTTMMSRPHMMI
ncbi:hypothetical protein CHS0354_027412 [Potamilus streckersoni]|uniref:PDZ domain-containing protein n=1 Tax=Potamilus streckersoni TaxID=2493646 RepID=A0AAE0SQE9_9BIVA|nr:hypothetical protein CHS0354_027412 [Potamilus streckersoni]